MIRDVHCCQSEVRRATFAAFTFLKALTAYVISKDTLQQDGMLHCGSPGSILQPGGLKSLQERHMK